MKRKIIFIIAFYVLIGIFLVSEQVFAEKPKRRIMVISSYHREYLWSQDTNKGVVAALLDFKYLDNNKQADIYTKNDYVESSRAIIKKLWMDTKRKGSEKEMRESSNRIIKEIEIFKPDLIMLGDDNAVNYIGNRYIDSKTPLVFWGINGLPLKYGMLESMEKPGHNITGVYQSGYIKETAIAFKKLVPSIQTFAILSDASETGREKVKELVTLAQEGAIPIKLVGTVITDSLSEWKSRALELQTRVDAFFVFNHNTIKDNNGKVVDQLEIGSWYLKNIKKPDASTEKQFVTEGILCAVDDSGFKQGYEATKIAHQILDEGKNPATIPSFAPEKGPFIVNRERAKMLEIEDLVNNNPIVEEYIDKALALAK